MKRFVKAIGAVFAIAAMSQGAQAQLSSQPSITALNVQVFCQGTQPYVSFVLPVAYADMGRAGMVFVSMRDQSGTAAMFLQGASWLPWESGLFPAYTSMSSGMTSQSFTLPLNGYLAGGGWMLYAGYGVLTDDAESSVRSYIDTVRKTEDIVHKKVNSIDPDHYRRTLIQADMVKSGKYSYISTGVENDPKICQPETQG